MTYQATTPYGVISSFILRIARMNWLLFGIMIMLCTASYFFVDSAVYQSSYSHLSRQQVMWIGVGLMIYFTILMFDYRFLLKFGLIALCVIALVLIVVVIRVKAINGAKSWIDVFGLFSVEPGEFAKLSLMLALGQLLVFLQPKIKHLSTIVIVGMVAAVPFLLILAQPDLGTALVLGPMTLCALWAAGARKRYILLPILCVALIFGFCYIYVYKQSHNLPGLKPYQNDRIRTFFDPMRDPLNAGWTIRQSLNAVGSGGLTGKGYKQGDQNIYGFLPKNISYNDFIFSVIAEEQGFFGGLFVILSEAALILCVILVASRAPDLGGVVVCCAYAGMLLTHFFVNVGMTIQVVPITGIPLPFISYGGTFMVSCMAGMGVVQSVWIERRNPIP